MVWCSVVWCSVAWCGVVWCGVVWCGVASVILLNSKELFLYTVLIQPFTTIKHFLHYKVITTINTTVSPLHHEYFTITLPPQPEDLFSLVEAHEGRPIKLYVYNTEVDLCREVTITPNSAWGGSGRWVGV